MMMAKNYQEFLAQCILVGYMGCGKVGVLRSGGITEKGFRLYSAIYRLCITWRFFSLLKSKFHVCIMENIASVPRGEWGLKEIKDVEYPAVFVIHNNLSAHVILVVTCLTEGLTYALCERWNPRGETQGSSFVLLGWGWAGKKEVGVGTGKRKEQGRVGRGLQRRRELSLQSREGWRQVDSPLGHFEIYWISRLKENSPLPSGV